MTRFREQGRRLLTGALAAALVAGVGLASGARAASSVYDFSTEDDLTTALVHGQVVDTAFDAADPEFGNVFNVSSRLIGSGGGHLGVTVFDSDLSGTADPDLEVGTGNILILQNDDSPGSSVDPTFGLVRTNPNDEASFSDRGAIVFSFLSPQELLAIDLVDVNGGVNMELTLTDLAGLTRVYSVPEMWTTDVTVALTGFQTLDLTTLLPQAAEPNAVGGDATATEDAGFDPTTVVELDIAIIGPSPSGGVDNLVIAPEPTTALLITFALLGLAASRRR